MIPAAVAWQLRQGLSDYLRYAFRSRTPGMTAVIDDLLAEPEALLKGPYVSLGLPFAPGSATEPFPKVPLGFTPYLHQQLAFDRLGGRRKHNTLVATGTGSGKTECFLWPILDLCRRRIGKPGIKAILVYPMNALATDQARRIAMAIHDTPALKGKVRAGLFIGQGGVTGKPGTQSGRAQMGPVDVITDRDTMRADPPDILLTNYKMLDYLLLRPADRGLWQHNKRERLRYLVVDELHTFDGAQGTDLACLIRRLKHRLEVDDGSLCCVGTSATMGSGDEAEGHLRTYATKVFGEAFDAKSVVGESRVSVPEFLGAGAASGFEEPDPKHAETLDPGRYDTPLEWLTAQAGLWLPDLDADLTSDAGRVALGEALKSHSVFRAVLGQLRGTVRAFDRLVERLARGREEWRTTPGFGSLALSSLLGLVSWARRWQGTRLTALVDVRLQLWQRELRRMVASVRARPRLTFSDDLDRGERQQHLPLVYCPNCQAMGWATRVDRDTPHLLRCDQQSFYRGFFGGDSQVRFIWPAAAFEPRTHAWRHLEPELVDAESLLRLPKGATDEGAVSVMIPDCTVHRDGGLKLSRDCPFCRARDSLTVLGFRASTLTAVFIDQLFASPFNSDKKLLTFSDAVQDAAHRAGFFGARTWRAALQLAVLQTIQGPGRDLTLAELPAVVVQDWQTRLPSIEAWVATFLPPNMDDQRDWERLISGQSLPQTSRLPHMIADRLVFEINQMFGLGASIGRSLPRVGGAAAYLDAATLDAAVDAVLEPLRNEIAGLRTLTREDARRFIAGLAHHLRRQGGTLHAQLPSDYVTSLGEDTYAFVRAPHLPNFGKRSRLPALLTDQTGTRNFDSWLTRASSRLPSWYGRWSERTLAPEGLTADAASIFGLVLPLLVEANLLRLVESENGCVWGLSDAAVRITPEVTRVACDACGHTLSVATARVDAWAAQLCLTARCDGHYAPSKLERDYFARLYGRGSLTRIFAREHTGLLTGAERRDIEERFKAEPGPDSDPDRRRPWDPNLLSCTPTLEMGIDIGDLSATVLCSVPPTQANYLQRIGRAGRRDGNALVLTVAGGRPHDQFFFADPEEMMIGAVATPGVHLDAAAVLSRQLAAFCFDRWVVSQGDNAKLPRAMKEVFTALASDDKTRFPGPLITFIDQMRPMLLKDFFEMFDEDDAPLSVHTREHLKAFLLRGDGEAHFDWRLLDLLHGERKQRDALRKDRDKLNKAIKDLAKVEAKAKDHDEQVELLTQEKEAIIEVIRGIEGRSLLEFLTNQGMLPNYAFPESAVRLRSVIWRKRVKPDKNNRKYEIQSYEYQRAPSSALSELAPAADFYAGGRKVTIDQVDLNSAEVEQWRFCPSCDHAEPVRADLGEHCPACEALWTDPAQQQSLLRLRQVFAATHDSRSRIRDEKDEREPRFFQRQMLVAIQSSSGQAWHIDAPELPFGFEAIDRARFSEINFGEPGEKGPKLLVAGRESIRPGFQVCVDCGKVQSRRRRMGKLVEVKHSLTCSTRQAGKEAEWHDCLYLYRRFESEAMRILLPTMDMATTTLLHSFIAALQLGLRLQFRGRVDHIFMTTYSEPVGDSALRRQYLMLYDAVPGGTGYLRELLEHGGGTLETLRSLLTRTLERIERCPCWNDPSRDGCYRCVLAWRNARDMADTSAQAAASLLRDILSHWDDIKPIESLGKVSLDGLMDSVLEARFVAALGVVQLPSGKTATVKKDVIGNTPGYRLKAGPNTWEVIPQVKVPAVDNLGVYTEIDFVLRPTGAIKDRQPIAVFLDGLKYHAERTGKDLLQRQSLIAGGTYAVWTFTWRDIDQILQPNGVKAPLNVAHPDPGKFMQVVKKQQLKVPALKSLSDVLDTPTFEVFARELVRADPLPWNAAAQLLVVTRLKLVQSNSKSGWEPFVQSAPEHLRQHLLAHPPKIVAVGSAGLDDRVKVAVGVTADNKPVLLAALNDGAPSRAQADYDRVWNGFWRLVQIGQQLEHAWFWTLDDSEAHDHGALVHVRTQVDVGHRWSDDTLDLVEDAVVPLAKKLMDAGVAEAEPSDELGNTDGDLWLVGELVWRERGVAVVLRDALANANGTPTRDWQTFICEDLEVDLSPLITALNPTETP